MHQILGKKIRGVKALGVLMISLSLFYLAVQKLNNPLFQQVLVTKVYSPNSFTKETTMVPLARLSRSRQPYLDCQNFTINLYRENTFNLTALVSYPGSGNTWLRHLIELATGIFTGSIYFDVELYGKGFLGEKEPWNVGSTIVQKLHMKYTESQLPFPKGIVLLRDPYKAIISFVQFLEGGHVGRGFQSTFYSKEWSAYVLGQTFSWISLVKSWLESPVNVLIVHYEGLMKDPLYELQRICDFLLVQCLHLNSACFQNHKDGEFHRKAKLKPKVCFHKWVRDKVDDGIDYLSSLLVQHGHDPLPLKLYSFYRSKPFVDCL